MNIDQQLCAGQRNAGEACAWIIENPEVATPTDWLIVATTLLHRFRVTQLWELIRRYDLWSILSRTFIGDLIWASFQHEFVPRQHNPEDDEVLVQVVAVGGTPPKSRYCDLINYALSSNFDPDKIEGFGINVMDTHELRVVRMRELWLGKNYPALLALLKQDEGEVMLGISYYHYLGSSLLILGMREQGEECLGEALQIEPRATVLRKYLAESRGTAFVTPQSPPLREYALSLLRHMQR